MTRYRHVETGSTCDTLNVAVVTGPIEEGQIVVVYRDETGSVWVRPITEFSDGRFEMIEPKGPAKTDFVPAADE